MIDSNLQSNLQTPLQTNQFTIEQNAHMFSMLIGKVYNDLILAPIREWSTNAIDAHILADNPSPFDVHLPTQDEPFFSVRDFGPGLHEDDILGLFSSFGSSTKRTSNAYNGQFGIGRMSGLAYSSSFTVDSYHNNIHYVYLITLQDGIPINAKLSANPTSEPSGLRLTLSVKTSDIFNFHSKAQSLYKYFDIKPNLNVELDIATPVSSQLSDDWYFHNDGYNNYVLMSNVRYTIDNKHFNAYNFRHVILKLPTGSVSITPGRESLSYDPKTIAAVQAAYDNALATAVSHSQDYIDEQLTPFDMLTTYSSLIHSLPSNAAAALTLNDPILTSLLTFNAKAYRTCKYTLSAATLGCAIKTRYNGYAKSKSHDYVEIEDFHRDTFVLCDSVQTQHAIDTINRTSSSNLVIFSKSSGTLQDFLNYTTPILDSLCIPYTRTSSYSTPEATKVARTGVHLLYSDGYKFTDSKKATVGTQYTYVPLNGFDVVPEYQQYFNLYCKFYNNKPFTLYGIQQKYLAEAEADPNFTLLGDAFVDSIRDNGPYIIAERCTDSPRCEFIHYDLPLEVPELIRTHHTEIRLHDVLVKDPKSKVAQCRESFDHFNIPYGYTTTTVTHDMLNRYPLYHHFNTADLTHYYLKLEYLRELHTNPSDQHTPLLDT